MTPTRTATTRCPPIGATTFSQPKPGPISWLFTVKFVSSTVACEYAGATKRAASVVRRNVSITQAQNGQPFTLVTSSITSLTVVGGSTYAGEFVGISGLRLRSGSTTLELQRRNLAPPAACP